MVRNVNQQSITPKRARELATELARWYELRARDLPWRHTRDPYAIWVSEVMLQQTRVEVVAGRWARFLERFPDVRSLAAAPASDVLAEWAGLGYYRRARMLHEAAQRIVDVHGGVLPTESATLRLLPGFGSYTAGAVASIAFGEKVSAVDGNVERVVSRLLALDVDPKRGVGAATIREFTRSLLESSDPRVLNQALMELGATVCTPRRTRCDSCPWRSACRARRTESVERYPLKGARKETVEVACYSAIARRGPEFLWRRRAEQERNAGLWELPTTEWHPGAPEIAAARDALEDFGRELLGRRWSVGEALTRVRHGITHHRITVVAHAVEPGDDPQKPWREREDLRWAKAEQARTWGLTAASVKLLDRLPSLL